MKYVKYYGSMTPWLTGVYYKIYKKRWLSFQLFCCVEHYVKNDDEIYLKTIIPSRKMHKHYKGWSMDLDKYEQELLKDIENAESFEQVDNYEDVLFETKLAAKNYLKKTKNINIRVAEYDILMLKRKSAEVNIPYQTILSSLIHQYVENKVNIKL